MALTPGPTTAPYTVLSQRSGTVLAPSGIGFDDVWIVDFRINVGPAAGTRAQVRLPGEFAQGPAVKDAVEAEFERIQEIANLGNPESGV